MSESLEYGDVGGVEYDPFAGPAISLVVASTEAQREVWAAAQMGRAASLAYNEAIIIRLRGALDVIALRAALGDLVARHEALRSTFSSDGLTLMIGEATELDMPVLDLTRSSETDREVQRQSVLRGVVTEEFDLEHGPLVRARLLQLSPELHELVLSAHHIICDGWSFGVIGSDLAALYNARHSGTSANLAPAESFSDYARETAEAAHGAERAEDEKYWLDQYKGSVPVLDLPNDRPRPALKTFDAGREDRTLSLELARAVRAAGMKTNSSMFATLLAGFSTLVHRLSGQDDLVLGVPSAGQSASGRTGLVGHCVNMLPIRVRPVGTTAFSDYLAAVRTTALDAFEHQRLGFGSLLERLQLPRDPSRIPLVSVMFNVDRSLPASAMPFDGIAAEMVSIPRAFENFDLFVNALETDDGLILECQYNSDLFDAATIRRWLESYERLLEGFVANPSATVGTLPILTDADRAALDSCNDTGLALPAETLVHRMIEAQAARTPDAIAIEFQGTRVSYAELNRRANKLAHLLREKGVRPGALVGLCLDRTPELLVALVAALKSGAGYVPLDPNYPADRLSYMASDAALAVLITDSRIASEVSLPATATVLVDTDAAAIAACPDADTVDSASSAQPEDTAYVIYTSGSTGKPKGVLVPHRSVVNLLASVQREPGLRSVDTVLAITTLSFDIAVSEVILPLTVGARIVLASREVASDGAMLMQLVESTGVTFIDATPATYRLLLASGWKGDAKLRVICTGEAMPKDLAETLTSCAAEVWNGYGPTETTVWSTFARVTSPVKKVLIGRPVANTVVQILDGQGQQTPIGVPGEMFIAGRGVTKGYLNRPDLTAERFIADPTTPGALIYRTGDLVRLLPTGELECLGRNDNQVKVRGFRIEPGEIEAVLMKWDGVREAAVIAREDRVNDVRLVAYLVTDSDDVISDKLRAFAKASLPDYMVPYTFVRMDAMPLTPSGKVDRKALPAPQAGAAVVAESEFVAPATEAETIIAGLWAEVLGLEKVSVVADFFSLGGHSLLASQVLSRLRRDHGIQLSFRKIFEAPTVRALGALVDQSRASGAPLSAPMVVESIPHRPDATVAPLSVLQERLWLLEELEPTQRSAHAHSASWRLFGDLDFGRLERAFDALIARHATLRTSFHTIDGERRQVVAPTSTFKLDRRDLSALDEAAQQEALVAYFQEQQYTTFDLSVAPLYRACIFKLADQHHLLYSLQHGMVWDGWSFDLFLKEVTELYAADEEKRAPVLNALPVTYGDFSAWQSSWLAGPEAKAQGEWWRAQLAGDLQDLALPTDFPRPSLSDNSGNQISLPFTIEEADQLRALARKYDATLFMVVFAAYNVILHHYTGQEDLLVGSPVRARTRPELEVIVGPFVNTVLLRTRVSPTLAFPDLLRAVRDTTLDSFSNQELPFELLGTRVPPVRALFSMQDARERPAAMGSLRVEQYHVPQHFTTNDLMLWMMDTRTKLYAVLNYSTELFERVTAETFLVQLRTFLMSVLENPERTVGSIDLSSAADRAAHDVPVTTDAEAPAPAIARIAVSAPERVAVRANGKSISYAELISRAQRVTGGLTKAGVVPGAPVGIALPVGIDRVVATLGAVGAGAAVLLLDVDDAAGYHRQVATAAKLVAVITDGDSDDLGVAHELTIDDLLDVSPVTAVSVAGETPSVLVAVPAAGGSLAVHTVGASLLAAQARDVVAALAIESSDSVVTTLAAGAPSAVLEMLAPLTAGATLVVASDDAREDASELSDELEDSGATVLFANSGLWQQLLATSWSAPATFRGVLVAGAFASGEDMWKLVTRVTSAFTLFGLPTDGGATCVQAARTTDGTSYANVLGVAGASLDVVDADGRKSPFGIPGRLRVSRGVAQVATGVRARRVSDGRIQLIRNDFATVWCDGVACSSTAIEEAVRQHPSVAEAAVAMHPDASGKLRVVAYVVPRPGARYTETELRTSARTRLPRRCVPQRIVELSALPIDARGVVRYEALLSPFAAAASATVQQVAPRNESEAMLAEAWKAALGVEQVSVLDNFFRLGGTSLLCFRVVEQVRKSTGRHLNPRALLVGTLEQAAAELATQSASTSSGAATAQESSGMFSRLKGLIS